jgi:SAM-dependent methyltransferase
MGGDAPTSREQQVQAESLLAQRLATAPAAERAQLYGEVYDRIYEMHLGREPETLEFGASAALVSFLEKLTHSGQDLVEVGCGAGLLAVAVAQRGREVLGVEVSERILGQARRRAEGLPELTLKLTCGTTIPAPDSSADLVYSVEVLEHLHADDVASHLREVFRVLRPGGRYWLLTPNRLDSFGSAERFGVDMDAVSDVHLKEWTYRELDHELRSAGFTALRSPWRNERLLWMPLLPASWFAACEHLPAPILTKRPVRSLLGIIACSIVATKPAGVSRKRLRVQS